MESQGKQKETRWFLIIGVPLAILASLWFVLVTGARMDTGEEFEFAVKTEWYRALPVGIAAGILALDFTRRWTILRRLGFVMMALAVVWLLTWRVMVYADYAQLRARGVDPEEVLRSLHKK